MTKIIPLEISMMSSVSKMIDKIFFDAEVPPSIGIMTSFDDSLRIKFNLEHGESFNWFKYWVAIDITSNEFQGIIGLYEESPDANEACWLGWYGVNPQFRGRGIGKELLSRAISEANLLNKKYLRVYTSRNQSRVPAMNLYKKYGFEVTEPKNKKFDPEVQYFELKLQRRVKKIIK